MSCFYLNSTKICPIPNPLHLTPHSIWYILTTAKRKNNQRKRKLHSDNSPRRANVTLPNPQIEKNEQFCLYSGKNQDKYRSARGGRNRNRNKRTKRQQNDIAKFEILEAKALPDIKRNKRVKNRQHRGKAGSYDVSNEGKIADRRLGQDRVQISDIKKKMNKSYSKERFAGSRDMRGSMQGNLYEMMDQRAQRNEEHGETPESSHTKDLFEESLDSLNGEFGYFSNLF